MSVVAGSRVIRAKRLTNEPWGSRDLVNLILLDTLALLTLLMSWYQASGTSSIRTGLAWLNVGIGALVASGVGQGIWLLRGREAVGLTRALILPHTKRELTNDDSATERSLDDTRLVTGVGMTRYHRGSCPFVEERTVTAMPVSQHLKAGRLPCEICEP